MKCNTRIHGVRAIKSTRGNVRILDRDMLIEIAGGCYRVPEQEYERLIEAPGRWRIS
jgi:hypothetical protein